MSERKRSASESDTASNSAAITEEDNKDPSPELRAWAERVLAHISRMTTDEEYRKQAKSFFP